MAGTKLELGHNLIVEIDPRNSTGRMVVADRSRQWSRPTKRPSDVPAHGQLFALYGNTVFVGVCAPGSGVEGADAVNQISNADDGSGSLFD
ncbi:hypothetical protein ABFU70_07580 [Xanthomonas campestris pv. campestris]|uniref:hypothetical protein n=1 Tax=Xanthomonas campestris TaxID=339 RepID=UPI0020C98562|nr:hypothetical protein [Xanthomonas campestris]